MGPGWDHHHGRTSGGVADSTGKILVFQVQIIEIGYSAPYK